MNKNKGFAHLFLLVVVVILAVGGIIYYSWQKGLMKTKINWKEYVNEEYGFSFKYPFKSSVEHFPVQKDSLNLIIDKGTSNYFSLSATKKYLPEDVQYFLDTVPAGEIEVGGKTWKYFSIREYYENDDGTKSPVYAIRTENKNILYTIFFPYQERPTKSQNQILSTFKFLED